MQFIAMIYFNNLKVVKSLVYKEFAYSNSLVACNGHGDMCAWQWGFMTSTSNSNFVLNSDVIFQLIDIDTRLGTNPINLHYLYQTSDNVRNLRFRYNSWFNYQYILNMFIDTKIRKS